MPPGHSIRVCIIISPPTKLQMQTYDFAEIHFPVLSVRWGWNQRAGQNYLASMNRTDLKGRLNRTTAQKNFCETLAYAQIASKTIVHL
jgi:hypothetical protein